MASVYDETQTGRRPRLASTILLIVLASAVVGAVSLARQRPIVPPPTPPPPAWAVGGHDAARTGHSRSYPASLPLTWLWERPVASTARPPVVDGVGNVYLSRADGALLSLSAGGATRWCAATQPVTDTACTGPASVAPAPPVAPSALAGPDGYLYVVDGRGDLAAFDPSAPAPLWRAPLGLAPDAGVVAAQTSTGLTLYGVAQLRPHALYTVVGVRWRGKPVPGWRRTAIHTRALTAVTVAPDGTLLVAASAPRPGGTAMLYALDVVGRVRWRVPLAPGHPSYVSVDGNGSRWAAWVAVQGARRSWVVVADPSGRTLWRWSVGHPLDVVGGGVSLAHPGDAPGHDGLGYVGSTAGVYALSLPHRHSWLFFDTRVGQAGAAGPPALDVRDTVYFATGRGHVYDVWPSGTTRWRYDTGRDADGPLALDPSGNVVVTSHDPAGSVVVEELGSGGTPLSSATAAACAPIDCPTPTFTPSPSATATPTATATITPTATMSPTVTPPPTPATASTGTPTLTPAATNAQTPSAPNAQAPIAPNVQTPVRG